MKKFKYVTSTEDGATEKGSVHAATKEDAAEKLRKEKKVIISLEETAKVRDWFWQRPSLSFVEKMAFTEHLATMMRVGVTVTEAMDILKQQTKRENNKRMFENIVQMIRSGQTLAKSLSEYDKIFSEVFISMISIGEESGTLEKTMDHLNLQLEKDYELRKRVISAFVYPIFIVSLTLLLTAGIIIFVLPKITKIFSSFDVDLPLPTRILMGTSEFVTGHPIISTILTIAFGGLMTFLIKTKHLKSARDNGILYIPIFGKLAKYVNLARFSRMLNSLMQAGVPITKSLQITSKMLTSLPYKEAVADAKKKVEKGGALGEAFPNDKLFPILVTKMILIGEKTGSLEQTTAHLANMYEKNVNDLTKNLSTLLEPILLVFMGMLVGGVAVSVILPIYQLPNLLQSAA